jgi:hypothetical protein
MYCLVFLVPGGSLFPAFRSVWEPPASLYDIRDVICSRFLEQVWLLCLISIVEHQNCLSLNFIPRLQFHRDYKTVCCFCGLVVRVPGYTTEKYCASCEVQTEFIYVM